MVNIEEKKNPDPQSQCPVCTYPCQLLFCALSRSSWKPDSASGGNTKPFQSLTNTAPRTCHISTQQPVPHRHKPHTLGEHRRELKEDRLGHCDSRTWGRSFTGNLSAWRRSLWSWEKIEPCLGGGAGCKHSKYQEINSRFFCQLCPA